jgi:hypothetical protein
VVIEPHNRYWLFALETAATLPEGSRMSYDGQLVSTSPVRERRRYELTSVIAPDAETRDSEGTLRRALRLPQGFNPRASALAAQWRAESAGNEQVLMRAIDFFARAATSTPSSRRCSARIRSTNSCSTRAKASASISLPPSCS